jgi:hypothetical protein
MTPLYLNCGADLVLVDIIKGLRLALYSRFYSNGSNRPFFSLCGDLPLFFLLKLMTFPAPWYIKAIKAIYTSSTSMPLCLPLFLSSSLLSLLLFFPSLSPSLPPSLPPSFPPSLPPSFPPSLPPSFPPFLPSSLPPSSLPLSYLPIF